MSERIHMVGIGGIGMSALAKLLLARGTVVSGSDAQASSLTAELQSLGARITIGHSASLVEGADRVVISDAIHGDNPELKEARARGIPIQRRSGLLGELMAKRRGIAVSGTHGKTTLTAMIGTILVEAGMDPTVVLGGEHPAFGGNARSGQGVWFLAEACEAYESFLDLYPEIAVITNIEADHLDHHHTELHLRDSFRQFVKRVISGGTIVLCADRPELDELVTGLEREIITYGTSAQAQVQGRNLVADGFGGRCQLWVRGESRGELHVGVPGRHNIVNALGATAAALRAGASVSDCQRTLARFSGVERRFEVLADVDGVVIVDDYAHHPTELTATIATARAVFPAHHLIAVFQPHLYSRTQYFAREFAQVLAAADLTILTDIYPAREAPIPGVSSRSIAETLEQLRGKDAVIELAKDKIKERLAAFFQERTAILIMGAGDIGQVARELACRLGSCSLGKREVIAKK